MKKSKRRTLVWNGDGFFFLIFLLLKYVPTDYFQQNLQISWDTTGKSLVMYFD